MTIIEQKIIKVLLIKKLEKFILKDQLNTTSFYMQQQSKNIHNNCFVVNRNKAGKIDERQLTFPKYVFKRLDDEKQKFGFEETNLSSQTIY